MSELLITALLFVVVLTGVVSVLYPDIFVSVVLLSGFSFLSALLFYVAHAPDVAITEAAVGAGMTTFIFVWAARSTTSNRAQEGEPKHRISPLQLLDIVLVASIGLILLSVLPPIEGGPEMLRDAIQARGYEETGAHNLVSAVYLGYRAFDTFGETVVLLCAVSGSVFLLSEKR